MRQPDYPKEEQIQQAVERAKEVGLFDRPPKTVEEAISQAHVVGARAELAHLEKCLEEIKKNSASLQSPVRPQEYGSYRSRDYDRPNKPENQHRDRSTSPNARRQFHGESIARKEMRYRKRPR